MRKIHIGHHKCGSTFLQSLIFPEVNNYVGRYYKYDPNGTTNLSYNDDKGFSKLLKDKSPYDGCRNLLTHYKDYDDVLISTELFSKLRPKTLFELLNEFDYNVLLVNRNLDDLIKSRGRHTTNNFYLMKKISKGIIDDEVKLHYSTENALKNINNITILDFDKLFSGDVEEITRLSEYLGTNINDKFIDNINNKVNENRRQ